MLPLAEAKTRLSAVVEGIVATHERVLLTRNGHPAVVMLAVEDYESIMETLDVLSEPGVLEDLRAAEAEAGYEELTPELAQSIIARAANSRAA